MVRIVGLEGRGAARRVRASLGFGGCLLLVLGCAESHDPLTGRCLEALAYRLPEHGDVEQIERGPSADGWTVTIRHAPGEARPPSQLFSCEYEVGDRWMFRRIVVGERELQENELTLVNAELFVRDLARSPERFGASGGPPPHGPGVSAPPPGGSAHRLPPPDA